MKQCQVTKVPGKPDDLERTKKGDTGSRGEIASLCRQLLRNGCLHFSPKTGRGEPVPVDGSGEKSSRLVVKDCYHLWEPT